jgi:hypothetical protein
MASLKVAVTLELSATRVAISVGDVELVVGVVVSETPELPPPPHPATKLIRKNAADHNSGLVVVNILFIFRSPNNCDNWLFLIRVIDHLIWFVCALRNI